MRSSSPVTDGLFLGPDLVPEWDWDCEWVLGLPRGSRHCQTACLWLPHLCSRSEAEGLLSGLSFPTLTGSLELGCRTISSTPFLPPTDLLAISHWGSASASASVWKMESPFWRFLTMTSPHHRTKIQGNLYHANR